MSKTRNARMTVAVIVGLLTAGVFHAEAIEVGSSEATAAVGQTVQMASQTSASLLPPGTTVDRVEWEGGILVVDLTIANPKWTTTDLEAEAISQALAAPFQQDPAFAGTVIRVRAGNRPYGSLADFVPAAPAAAGPAGPTEPAPESARTSTEATVLSLGGPTANAARQPTGPLSGVVIFVSAGHGWVYGTTDWALQRPGDLWDMNEDYGNLDQMNYFVHYAFNAGATVVPYRPVGWQESEIVLDNDDPGVTYTGTWNNGSSTKYYENGTTLSGIVYKTVLSSTTETATARYTPNVTVSDFYPVYCFTIASSNRTLQTYRVKHSGGITAVTIDHRLVGNGWIWLGDYYLAAGGDNYVEITNQSPESGYIIADAIRWGGGVGDVARGSPAVVSGYPRDEECSRYWAHSELGDNAIGFSATAIWDSSTTDQNDNVRTAAHWAREMNQETYLSADRWRRIYYEFHTNASTGTARGCMALITDLGATTYQTEYATFIANEIDADLLLVQNEFEHTWYDRAAPTYTGSYGAICTPANGNEFDATIIELAFHDNQLDAELLRDDRVRAAAARSSVQGIIRFLNWMPGSTVPLAFAPDTPRNVQAVDTGNGNVTLSWAAPLSDGARGDPATGYVIYQSTNGYGFGSPIVLGNVLTHTISGVPAGQTQYYRVAATNAGGESMPSEVLAVRRPATGTGNVLIVNGFDRLRRQQNYVQTFTFPPAYAGLSPERQIWRRSNSYDYVVQHAEALAAVGEGFSSCANEAVGAASISLGSYPAVVWACGEESTTDETFSAAEQTQVTAYLNAGGRLFVSGAEIGWDLDASGAPSDQTFYNGYLKADYVTDDAGTYNVAAASGSIFEGMAAFSFDNGAALYDVDFPDTLALSGGSTAGLNYVGGTGGIAATVFSGAFKVVNFAFPFETITSAATRADIMGRVMDFFLPQACQSNPECDDGLFCNGAEFCDAQFRCQAGTPVDCNDGVACTDDSCNEGTYSCDHVANDAACDNGLYCDGAESCHATLGCQAGVSVDCNDSVACTVDSCNEGTDSCDHAPNNAACDNGLYCDGAETCNVTLGCQPGSDPCPGLTCDEVANACVGGAEVWLSFIDSASVPSVGTVENEDIVARNVTTGAWSLIFDGSDVGLSAFTIDGVARMSDGSILLSFAEAGSVPGMTGGPSGTTLDDSDIVRFIPTSLGANTAGSFVFYFDGSDVGLTSNNEDIDAIALTTSGQLVISTLGSVSANGASGADTDLLLFNATSLGSVTAGTFSVYFDGSDVGLTDNGSEDVDAVAIRSSGVILLSTLGAFSVPGVTGDDEDVIEFTPTQLGSTTSGTYLMYLDLSTLGIATSENVGAVEYKE